MSLSAGIAWKRVLLFGFIAAAVDAVVVNLFAAALIALGIPNSHIVQVLTLSTGSFVFTFLFGQFVARKTASRVLNGFLVGVAAFVFLEAPIVITTLFSNGMPPDAPPPWVYNIANIFKFIGGLAGGLFAARSTARQVRGFVKV